MQHRYLLFFAACLSFIFTTAVLGMPALPIINTNNIVVITNAIYGAVGDGVTTNTTPIQNAINQAAKGGMINGAAGGTVEIPPGIYLSGPLTMASSVNLQIDAGAILRMLPLDKYPGGTSKGTTFISGSNLHDIEISGKGAIDGQGEPWWPYANTNGALRPRMISPSNCNRLLIQDVTLSNSPMFHIAISGSHAGNSTVQGVTIRAPSSSANPPSHNTDACDVDGTNILVQNCNISVGDDDFTCGGGTHDVLVTNNIYGNGHGVSIGSYTDSGGVSNITVVNCTFTSTDNGIRIKSDNNRGGLVQNISYKNITMTNVHFPVQIYAYYNEIGTPSNISPNYAATQTVAAVTSETPIYRNITFSNITATAISGYPAVILWARKEMPMTNIFFSHINISASKPFEIYNARQIQIADSQVSGNKTNFLLFNAQVAITNSSPTANFFTFDGLTTNNYGNSFYFYNTLATLQNTNVLRDGPVTLDSSTLTIGNDLTLYPSTVLNFHLGTKAAKIAVNRNLNLGGTINVTNGAGFTDGTYTILTYNGKLNGVLPTLETKPANYNFSLDTNTVGQVNLVVAPLISLTPTNLSFQVNGNQLQLFWPADHIGWYLQIQTNDLTQGLRTNWNTVFNSNITNRFSTPVDTANGTVFFRLISP